MPTVTVSVFFSGMKNRIFSTDPDPAQLEKNSGSDEKVPDQDPAGQKSNDPDPHPWFLNVFLLRIIILLEKRIRH